MRTFGTQIPKTNGLFSAMPETVPWAGVLTPARMDLRAWANLNGLGTSALTDALTEDGVTDVTELAAVIYEMYSSNWQRLWDALLVEYDILESSTQNLTRTVTTTHDDLETQNLNRTDGGTVTRTDTATKDNVRTGGSTETSSRTGESEEDTTGSGTSSTTETKSEYGVGGSGAVATESTTGSNPTSTTGKVTASDSDSGTSSVVFNALTDAESGTSNGTETQQLTSANTGTIGNEGTATESEELQSAASSPLYTHQRLVDEETLLRTGIGHNFVDLIIQDVRHETCGTVWVRGENYG